MSFGRRGGVESTVGRAVELGLRWARLVARASPLRDLGLAPPARGRPGVPHQPSRGDMVREKGPPFTRKFFQIGGNVFGYQGFKYEVLDRLDCHDLDLKEKASVAYVLRLTAAQDQRITALESTVKSLVGAHNDLMRVDVAKRYVVAGAKVACLVMTQADPEPIPVEP